LQKNPIKRLYSTKESYHFTNPTDRSHPVVHIAISMRDFCFYINAARLRKDWVYSRECRVCLQKYRACLWEYRADLWVLGVHTLWYLLECRLPAVGKSVYGLVSSHVRMCGLVQSHVCWAESRHICENVV